MSSFTLDPVTFQFCDRQMSADRILGLQDFGPTVTVPNSAPRFGFVFPSGSAHYANQLYLALKNGIGDFRGFENTFRCPLNNDQVFPIPVTGYSPDSMHDHSEIAKRYKDTILSWCEFNAGMRPDLLYVLHPRTLTHEINTAYYECKAQLLRHGLVSQNVTLDLLDSEAQFRSSVANIALASFAKLGGTPWLIRGASLDRDLVIGTGRAYLFDVMKPGETSILAFTTCFSAQGLFKFVHFGELVDSREKYLDSLTGSIEYTIKRATSDRQSIRSITIYTPQEMCSEEMQSIHSVLESNSRRNELQLVTVKITEESQYFVVDSSSSYGIPPRGTVVQATDRDMILYTEDMDKPGRWSRRMPLAMRVTPESDTLTEQQTRGLLRQVNDLSQLNYHGFNAPSIPIPTYYGSLITNLISHIPRSIVAEMQEQSSSQLLHERMWFL